MTARRSTPDSTRRRFRIDAPVATVLAIGLALGLATPARADTEACAKAYETAQTLRQDGKLLESRRELVTCAQDACPPILRKDCVAWLGDVEREIPTLSIRVVGDDGCDRPEARVWIDDVVSEGAARGRPIAVDPGSHRIRAEIGKHAVERAIAATPTERARGVTLSFADEGVTCGVPRTQPIARAADASSPRRSERPFPLASVIAGSFGIVSLGVGTGFAISGWNQKGDLDACKGACATADVDRMERTFRVSDIAIGTGIVALAAATVLYFVR